MSDLNHIAPDVAAIPNGHPGSDGKIFLPMREWLELGQEMTDRCRRFTDTPRWFRPWHTQVIRLGRGITIEADGKKYGSGDYVLGHGT